MRKDTLAELVLRGDRRAVARAVTKVENGEEDGARLLEQIGGSLGRSFVLGVTGPPGTGKSTVVDRLIEAYRKRRAKVGVIAVDPTSPLTGGALLGDRVRMLRHTMDPGVFIRSMASRGWSGGLSGAVSEVIQVLDAAGMDVLIVETVGIGQSDIEVMKIAHAVLVVTMPGMGDDIQVSKAGLMEIGDAYVVNKSDLMGADAMFTNLLSMVKSSRRDGVRRSRRGEGDRGDDAIGPAGNVITPPVLKVSALKNEGVDALFQAVEALRLRFLSPEGRQMRLRSNRGMIVELAKRRLLSELEDKATDASLLALAQMVSERRLTLEEAARRLAEGRRTR